MWSRGRFHVLFGLFLFSSISAISANENEDFTIKTMEAFSGYPIHGSNSSVRDFVSSLSVDTQTLQNQIDELETFSDAPAPSVIRILYTEKDVFSRRCACALCGDSRRRCNRESC